jgi:hypothetical protein
MIFKAVMNNNAELYWLITYNEDFSKSLFIENNAQTTSTSTEKFNNLEKSVIWSLPIHQKDMNSEQQQQQQQTSKLQRYYLLFASNIEHWLFSKRECERNDQ